MLSSITLHNRGKNDQKKDNSRNNRSKRGHLRDDNAGDPESNKRD